jgi:hypothetical protein
MSLLIRVAFRRKDGCESALGELEVSKRTIQIVCGEVYVYQSFSQATAPIGNSNLSNLY